MAGEIQVVSAESPGEVASAAPMSMGALGALIRSEIDTQVATAKAFPRSVRKFLDEAQSMATLNESVAVGCRYVLPRDGKKIEGPSARFAEIIASAWGNCRVGARVIGEDNEFVTAQGFFFDVERNYTVLMEIKRRITDKNGRRYNTDMIAVTSNAACSIAARNAVAKGIPKAFWSPVYDEVRRVILGDAKTLVTRRADMISAFRKMGITETTILESLGAKGVEDIGLEELAGLRGLYTAIQDGDTTIEEVFPVAEKPKKATKGIDGLKAAVAPPAAPEPPPAAPTPPAPAVSAPEPAPVAPQEPPPAPEPPTANDEAAQGDDAPDSAPWDEAIRAIEDATDMPGVVAAWAAKVNAVAGNASWPKEARTSVEAAYDRAMKNIRASKK